MADVTLAVLRAIHILGNVIWVGGTIVAAAYHEYIIDPGDPRRTLERLAAYDAMSNMIGASGIVGILAGLVLYWIVSGGLDMAWITSAYGTSITVGAVAALIAFAIALPLVARTNSRTVALNEEVGDADELSAEQAETVERLRGRLVLGERSMAVFMTIAVLAMAVAQTL